MIYESHERHLTPDARSDSSIYVSPFATFGGRRLNKNHFSPIGEKIRLIRGKLGFSQKELAGKIGVGPETISRWETNVMNVRPSNFGKLCLALNCCAADLCHEQKFIGISSIAFREFVIENKYGDRSFASIEIFIPQIDGDGDYSCKFRASGIILKNNTVYGGDSWQVIQIARDFISDALAEFIDNGGKIFWPGTVGWMQISDFFP